MNGTLNAQIMRMRALRMGIATFVLAITPMTAALSKAPVERDSLPYRVVDGKVDEATYRGWRAYHSACHTCHGPDGIGTSIAPSLVDAVRKLSAKQFSIKVVTSYRIVFGSDEIQGDDQTALRERFAEEILRRERGELVMPSWDQNPDVKPHVLDLYAYLRARSDGALGPGKPQQLKPSKTTNSGESP